MPAVLDPKPTPSKFDDAVRGTLDDTVRKIRLTDALTGGLIVAAVALTYTVTVVLLDRWLDLPGWVRQLGLLGLLAGVGTLGWYLVLRPYRRQVNPRYVARQVEGTIPDAKNAIINWVDLQNREIPGSVRSALSARAAAGLSESDPAAVVSSSRMAWAGGFVAALVGILAVLFLMYKSQFLSLLGRALNPFSDRAIVTRTDIELVFPQGDLTVTDGQQIGFAVRVTGKIPNPGTPEQVRLKLRYAPDAEYDEYPLERGETIRDYAFTAGRPVIQNGFWFRIAAGDAETPEYRVNVRARPTVTAYEVKYEYPEYLRLKPDTGREPRIDGFRGTNVTLTVKTNRSVKSGELAAEIAGQEAVFVGEVVGDTRDSLKFHFTLTDKGTYTIRFKSDEGEDSGPTMPHPLDVYVDQAPSILLQKPEQEEVALPTTGLLAVDAIIGDDHGITSATLKFRVAGGPPNGPAIASKTFRDGKTFQRESDKTFPTTLDYKDSVQLDTLKGQDGKPLKLVPETILEYWLEAVDNYSIKLGDTVLGPNVGKSKIQRVKLTKPDTDPAQQQQRQQQRLAEEQKNNQQADRKNQAENRDPPKPQNRDRAPNEQPQQQPDQQNPGQGQQDPGQGQPNNDNKQPDPNQPPQQPSPMGNQGQGAGQQNESNKQPPEKQPNPQDASTQEKADDLQNKIDNRENQPGSGKSEPNQKPDEKPQENPGQGKPGDKNRDGSPPNASENKDEPKPDQNDAEGQGKGAGDVKQPEKAEAKPGPQPGQDPSSGDASPKSAPKQDDQEGAGHGKSSKPLPGQAEPPPLKPGEKPRDSDPAGGKGSGEEKPAEGQQPQPKPDSTEGSQNAGQAKPNGDVNRGEARPQESNQPGNPNGPPPAQQQPDPDQKPGEGKGQAPPKPGAAKPKTDKNDPMAGQPETAENKGEPKPGDDVGTAKGAGTEPDPKSNPMAKPAEKGEGKPGQQNAGRADPAKQKEIQDAARDLASNDEAKKQAAREKLDKTIGKDAREKAEKLAEDMKSGDPKRQEQAQKELDKMAKEAGSDKNAGQNGQPGQPRPLNEDEKKKLGDAAKDLNNPDPEKRQAAEKATDEMIGQGQRQKLQQQMKDFDKNVNDLGSEDAKTREAAKENLDKTVGKDVREKAEKMVNDQKSADAQKQADAKKKSEELAREQAGKKANDANAKPQELTEQEKAELAEAAKNLSDPDGAKRKAAEQKLDERLGQKNREELQQDLKDLQGHDPAKAQAAKEKLEQKAKEAKEQQDKEWKWRPGGTPPKGPDGKPLEDNPANRLKAAELQLETFKKYKDNREFLKEAGYSKEEYERFVKGYEEMVTRQKLEVEQAKADPNRQPNRETPLNVSDGTGANTRLKSGTAVQPGGPTANGSGVAPPGFDAAHRRFIEEALKKK